VAFREAGLDRLRRGLERAGLDAHGSSWPPPNEPTRPVSNSNCCWSSPTGRRLPWIAFLP
jgi:hypothetical protein